MGRLDNQQQNKVGRLPREVTTGQQAIETPTPRKGNFITNAPSNVAALFRGEVGLGAVAKEVPGTLAKVADTVTPAASNFVRTTGGIIGEGLAYASSKDVREQYKAGNLDILPTVSKTTQKDLLKDTVAAGLEATILRSVPAAMSGKLATRAGIGGLEGIGFAIAEGMARDQSPDEILKNATLYGVSGAALNVAIPWLGPLLRKELSKAPAGLKNSLKKEAETVAPTIERNAVQPEGTAPANVTPTAGTQTVPTQTGQAVPVQGEQLPIGGPTKGLSQLEHRALAKTEDPAYQASYENYRKSVDNVDGPEITGASNPEQIRRAAEFRASLTPEQNSYYVNGGVIPQELGILRTAFLKEAAEQAALEGNSTLVATIARRLGQIARRFGQEIQFTKNFNELDASTNIADLLSVRLKAVTDRLPGTQTAKGVIGDTVAKGQKELTKTQLKINDAEALINSIELC